MSKKYNTPHRTHPIKTMLTEEEYSEFAQRCNTYQMSQAEVIRQAISGATIKPVIKVSAASDEFLDVLGKILAELGKNGSNLNQIAKVLNEFHAPYVQLVTGYIYHHQDHFRMVMEQQLHTESEKQIKANRKALERDEKRIAELKRLFIKTYEDNASGKLSDERFEMLSQTYEAEQKELEEEVLRLEKKIEVQETQIQNIETFIPARKIRQWK